MKRKDIAEEYNINKKMRQSFIRRLFEANPKKCYTISNIAHRYKIERTEARGHLEFLWINRKLHKVRFGTIVLYMLMPDISFLRNKKQ